MVRVLVVDDSAVARELVVHILESDPSIEVIGTCENGLQAIFETKRLRPDAITMDINMPVMDGFVATREIMEITPTPIVIVSSNLDKDEVATTFLGVEAGALAVVQRPPGVENPEHAMKAEELIDIVKSMSEVKLVRRWSRPKSKRREGEAAGREPGRGIKLIAIGASTGGPIALRSILCDLPDDFPLPILVVQHIAHGFIDGFAEWLDRACGLTVSLARNGEIMRPAHVYVAPDLMHMRAGQEARISLIDDPPVSGLKPAIATLFKSAAENYGNRCAGVLLTGMGRDGADELLLMKERGAITIAQDETSSVIHGMPGEAIKLGAAKLVLPLSEIATTLIDLTKTGREDFRG